VRDEVVREPLFAVEFFGDRRDLIERELPYRVAQQLVLGVEIEVQVSLCASSTINRTPYPVPPWSSA
jgi:hypothetical protein